MIQRSAITKSASVSCVIGWRARMRTLSPSTLRTRSRRCASWACCRDGDFARQQPAKLAHYRESLEMLRRAAGQSDLVDRLDVDSGPWTGLQWCNSATRYDARGSTPAILRGAQRASHIRILRAGGRVPIRVSCLTEFCSVLTRPDPAGAESSATSGSHHLTRFGRCQQHPPAAKMERGVPAPPFR